MRVHHLAIAVLDLQRSEAFYRGVLSLPELRRHHRPDGSLRSIWLALGDGAFLALEEVEGGAARTDASPGLHCLALFVTPDERERWRERLGRAGVPVERESEHTLYVRDPDGVLVGLSHYPEPRG